MKLGFQKMFVEMGKVGTMRQRMLLEFTLVIDAAKAKGMKGQKEYFLCVLSGDAS